MMIYLLGAGAGLLAGASVAAWWRGRAGWAMALLMGAALLLRLLMAGLDPFLHDWDERFHALVARNMMAHPGRPMLRADPLLPYDYQAWCCNHIWLHKQPLFLWQMALAMKLFGVSTLAMRLPSIVLSTLVLWPVYRLGRLVFNDPLVGYLGALLAAFTYYQLELVSGAIGMDHDDVAFLVYVTGSIWAYYEYRASARPTRWLVLVGVLAGAAVLCKWLTGLLVYAGWGLALLLQLRRGYRPLPEMARLLASLAVAVAVILPWQLYTARRFPVESAFERAYNTRHFTEALEGHGNVWYYHFELLPIHYGLVLGLVLLGIGLALRPARWRAALPLLAMVALIYLFFSLAATKMYSYTYVVSLLLLLLAALPLAAAARWLGRQASRWRWVPLLGRLGLAAVLAVDLRPWDIAAYHLNEETPYPEFMPESLNREVREANAALYRQLGQEVPVGYTVFNAGVGTELEAMFFSGRNVYAGTPSEEEVRQLRARGVGLAVYGGHTQSLPGYLTAPGIVQLWGAAQ